MVADKDTPKFSVLTHLILWDWKTHHPLMPQVTQVQGTRDLVLSTLRWALLLNSHSRTQTNVMKILELSMHNSEAKEEALASGTASQGSTPLCPGKRDLHLPLTLPIWVREIINSSSKLKEGINKGSHWCSWNVLSPSHKAGLSMLLPSGLCWFFLKIKIVASRLTFPSQSYLPEISTPALHRHLYKWSHF